MPGTLTKKGHYKRENTEQIKKTLWKQSGKLDYGLSIGGCPLQK